MELAQKINILREIEVFSRLGEDELRVAALCLRERTAVL